MTLLIAFLTSNGALAQTFTLHDCIVYAHEHAYANRIKAVGEEMAAANVRRTASRLMPSLGLSASGNISFGRNIDPETNTYDNKQTLSSGFGLHMSVPLFDGLVSVNNLRQARATRERMHKSAVVEQDRITISVVEAFYKVAYCKAMVAQMEEQLNRDRQDLSATERQKDLGTKSGADVAEIRAMVAGDEYELLNRKNMLKKAYLTLRSKMGMELSEEEIELTETAADEEKGFSSGIMLSNTATHPKIAEAELSCKEMRYGLRAAKGGYSPTIDFTAGISTSYYRMPGTGTPAPSFASQWRNNMGEYLGLSVSIPLFDGLATLNTVRHARLSLRESELRLEEAKYELERETMEAALDYSSACEEHKAAVLKVEAEEIAYKAVRRKYELGMSSVTDLYTSAAKLSEAKANREGKRIQKIISAITLDYCRRGVIEL